MRFFQFESRLDRLFVSLLVSRSSGNHPGRLYDGFGFFYWEWLGCERGGRGGGGSKISTRSVLLVISLYAFISLYAWWR